MIDFAYKEIAKIIELADYEIERISRIKKTISSLNDEEPAFTREETETPEDSRVRKEKELLNNLKNKLEGELDKVVFKFGSVDKNSDHFNKEVK